MNKSILITAMGIVALFLLQGFWLYRTHILYIKEKETSINEWFKVAIDKELAHREFKYKDPKNPKFAFKSANAMTPKERERLKGDTINYKDLSKKGIAQNFSEAVSQMRQEQLASKKPLLINALDSLFRKELSDHNLSISSCEVTHLNRDTVIFESAGACPPDGLGVVTTGLKPIGIYASHFVQARVKVAPTDMMISLRYNLIASFGIALFIIAALYYQLVVIVRDRKKLQAQEAAIYNAIHDLKSPLNGVFALLDTVTEIVKGDAEMEKFTRKGKAQIKRLTQMIETLLEATRRQERACSLKLEETDLREMITLLKEEIAMSYPEKRYTFRLENTLETDRIRTDRVLIERCIRNLLENAFKYSDEGVEITVTLSRTGNRIRLAIKDTGWGIPQKERKRIGDLFFQAKHAGKPKQAGYGVGLCSVKTLSRKLGGSVFFQSEEGKGSTFFLELPQG